MNKKGVFYTIKIPKNPLNEKFETDYYKNKMLLLRLFKLEIDNEITFFTFLDIKFYRFGFTKTLIAGT